MSYLTRVKHKLFHMKLDRLLFWFIVFLQPLQTRYLFNPETSYIRSYFNYHQAIFLYMTDILVFTCFISALISRKPQLKHKSSFFLASIGIFAVILVSLFHVKHLPLGIYETLKWLEFFGLVSYIWWTFETFEDYRTTFGLIALSATLQAILGWWQFHVQHMLGLKWLGEYIAPMGTPGLATINTSAGKVIRAYGTMPHPNLLGAFLVFGLILSLYFVSHGTKWIRILGGVALFLVTIGLFTTFSRVSWAAAILATLSFIIFHLRSLDWRKAIYIIAIGIVSCATVFIFFPNYLKARVNDSDARSISDRQFFNQLAWNVVLHYPVTGVGIGNYVEAQKEFYHLEDWQYQPPHNIYLFIAAELGLLGLGLFLMILYQIFAGLKNIFWQPLPFTLALTGIIFLLMGMFDHYFVTIQQGRLMFATVLGLIAAVPNLYDHQKSN
jgi:hypothetical protein